MTGFEMRYLFGEGSTEMWGANGVTYSTDDPDAANDPRKSAVATVYSRCARLTIQKLIGTRENPGPLAWNPELGQWTGNIEPPDFNRGVWEAGEGPGGYSAEINVRGRLIYGYNWRVAQLHPVDTAGDYRLTFSVDGPGPDATPAHCDVAPNTDLSLATILPGGGEGGVPAIDALNNLTYIDVRILPGDGGSSGGGGSGGGGCQGGGSGGGHGGAGGGGCQDGGPSGVALAQAPGDVHDGGEEEEQNPIKDADGNLVDRADIETGSAGASRPNLGLVSSTAIVAYEETKGAGAGQGGGPDGETAGKFVRYHQFKFQSPPADEIGKAGCIVSDPAENGRRVRLVTQGQAGAKGLRWAIFWRQGIGGQGASADIALRLGYTNNTNNFGPANLYPAVDLGCETSIYEEAIGLGNAHPLNVSSNTPVATEANLADATDANSVENARAHRALLRGDDLYVGYTYTENDALAQSIRPRANYNFWMRHFDAAAGTWASPKNLSRISNLNVDAKEPRLMGTPGSVPNCSADPEDCQNTSIFFAAWGTERKDPVTGAAVDLDIFVTCTTDKGEDFVPAIRIARGDNVNDQAEDQLRSTPDGSRVFSVWNEQESSPAQSTPGSPSAPWSEASVRPAGRNRRFAGGRKRRSVLPRCGQARRNARCAGVAALVRFF